MAILRNQPDRTQMVFYMLCKPTQVIEQLDPSARQAPTLGPTTDSSGGAHADAVTRLSMIEGLGGELDLERALVLPPTLALTCAEPDVTGLCNPMLSQLSLLLCVAPSHDCLFFG